MAGTLLAVFIMMLFMLMVESSRFLRLLIILVLLVVQFQLYKELGIVHQHPPKEYSTVDAKMDYEFEHGNMTPQEEAIYKQSRCK